MSTETEKLKAGRELDARMARAMGLRFKENDYEYWPDGVLIPSGTGWKYWSPSINIADAFEVVEKLKKDGYLVLISSDSICLETLNEGWGCDISGRHIKDIKIIADTAPLAICLAALKVMDERESG